MHCGLYMAPTQQKNGSLLPVPVTLMSVLPFVYGVNYGRFLFLLLLLILIANDICNASNGSH